MSKDSAILKLDFSKFLRRVRFQDPENQLKSAVHQLQIIYIKLSVKPILAIIA